ncbi:hypothetical protein ABBQ38_015331 [Trebouxia sp. C0009 RCD-2024]
MGVGSIPDSPPMPPGDTAEERERAWAAAHPPTAQPYESKAQPQQQQFQPQQQQFQPSQQQYTPTGGQGLYPQPVAGIAVRGPLVAPQPGHVLLGYQVCEPRTGCCECDNLSPAGWISIILLLLFFWPLFWIPFVMPECYERYQIPIYGQPGVSTQHAGSVGQGMPIAQPYNQQ